MADPVAPPPAPSPLEAIQKANELAEKDKIEKAISEELKDSQAVMERYQSFASELLRISLLGIALLGFFIEKIAHNDDFPKGSREWTMGFMAAAAVAFAVSAAAALGNRYYLAEVGFYFVRVLRPNVKTLPHVYWCRAKTKRIDNKTVVVCKKDKDGKDTPETESEYGVEFQDKFRQLLFWIFPKKKIKPESDIPSLDNSMLQSCGGIAAMCIGVSATAAGVGTIFVVVAFAISCVGYILKLVI